MFKIGFGYDSHMLTHEATDRNVKLFSVPIDTKNKIRAISDGDVGIHSLSNAILGAIGLQDIGHYFSTKTTEQNYNSVRILNFALQKLHLSKYRIINIDITFVCDAIYLYKYKLLMKQQLANLLKMKPTNISVKAATSEGAHPNFIVCYSTLLIAK